MLEVERVDTQGGGRRGAKARGGEGGLMRGRKGGGQKLVVERVDS